MPKKKFVQKKPDKIRLYHGTADALLHGIRKDGLIQPCLTDWPRMAEEFARGQVQTLAAKYGPPPPGIQVNPVVLEVDVDTSRLTSDSSLYLYPIREVVIQAGIDPEEYPEIMRSGKRAVPEHHDWEKSLKEMRSVRYDGTIPWSSIVKIRQVTPGPTVW